MEIFRRYDIDLEDNDSLDFGDLLEKAFVLVKRRKCLADFIRNKETYLINKYTELQEKIPTAPNIVAQDLNPPTRFQTVQGAVREGIPIVRIHASRIEEVKAGEVSLSDNDYVLVCDPTEDFYENLGALFADCKPVDEDLEQLRVGSVTTIEHFKHLDGTKIGKRRLDIKSKRALQRLEPQAPKEDGIGIVEGRYPGPVTRRPMQRAIKSEDHG